MITSLDIMLRVALIPRGLIKHQMAEAAETNFDEFKRNDCVFVANWLKTKGLHKHFSVFEGVQNRFISLFKYVNVLKLFLLYKQ